MSPSRFWSAAVLLSVALLTTGTHAASKSDFENLLRVLFQNYSSDVRPVNDFDRTTSIFLTLCLNAIIEVSCRQTRKWLGGMINGWNWPTRDLVISSMDHT